MNNYKRLPRQPQVIKNTILFFLKVVTVSIIFLPIFTFSYNTFFRYFAPYTSGILYPSIFLTISSYINQIYCYIIQYWYRNNYFESSKLRRPQNIKRKYVTTNLKDFIEDSLTEFIKNIINIAILVKFGNFSNQFKFQYQKIPYYALSFLLQIILADLLIYSNHRFLHQFSQGKFYYLHKFHHLDQYPIGYDIKSKTFTESLIEEELQVLPFFMLFGGNILFLMVSRFVQAFYTIEQHSGYALFFTHDDFHEFHHSHNSGNYGVAPYLDYILGTHKTWFEYRKGRLD